MEASKEEEESAGIFDKILPPRLEDAGLEECALPPDSIREAFLKAASAVTSRATSILIEDDDDGDCVHDPWPQEEDVSDDIVGMSPEQRKPDALVAGDSGAGAVGPCVAEKGGGVVVGGGDVVEEIEKGKDCLAEGLKGLEIKEEKEKKKERVNID